MILTFQLISFGKQVTVFKNKKLLMYLKKVGATMIISYFESKEQNTTDPIMKDFYEENMEI